VLDSAVLAAPRLVESSGVAPSSRVAGVFWTLNDSGDGPVLYATDAVGRDLGSVRVAGARATDWEDLASAPCLVIPGRCLYVSDTGDNGGRRPYVLILRIPEPDPPTGPGDTSRTVPVQDSLVVRYPDRRHDAEALVVLRSGQVLLVTKDRSGPALLFRVHARGPSVQVAERVGVLPIHTNAATGRIVTGAAVSPDGQLLVVRTYVSLHLFRLAGAAMPVPLTTPRGITIPFVEAQGEAVTFVGPDTLLLTSERGSSSERGTLVRLALRGLR
jgi:hypothetical protein